MPRSRRRSYAPWIGNSLRRGLVFFAPLNETGGDRTDKVGPRTLTDVNSVGSTTGIGGAGTAADIVAASSQYLTTADFAALSFANDFSVGIWWKPADITQSGHVFGQWSGTTADKMFVLYQAAAQARFYCQTGGASNLVSPGNVSAGTWYCWYAEYDKSAAKMRTCLNNAALVETAAAGALADPSSALTIGSFNVPGSYANGAAQYAAIWNRRLNTAERAKWYSGGAGFNITG